MYKLNFFPPHFFKDDRAFVFNEQLNKQLKAKGEKKVTQFLQNSNDTFIFKYLSGVRNNYHLVKGKDSYLYNYPNLIKNCIVFLSEKLRQGQTTFDDTQLKTIYKIIIKLDQLGNRDFLADDFSIKNFDEELKCNSLLLACQSRFFADKFNSGYLSSHEVDANADVLRLIHHYMKTGLLGKLDRNDHNFIGAVIRKASEWDLYRLIKKLDIPLTPETIIHYLDVAVETGAFQHLEDQFNRFFIEVLNPNQGEIDLECCQKILRFARHKSLKWIEEACLEASNKLLKKSLWGFFTQEDCHQKISLFKDKCESLKMMISQMNSLTLEEKQAKKSKEKEGERVEEEEGVAQASSSSKLEDFKNLYQLMAFYISNGDEFDRTFLSSLHLPELMLLLMLFPEKVKSLDLAYVTIDQLEVLLPWLPKDLKEVTLSPHLTIETIQAIVDRCQSIESLSILGIKDIPQNGLKYFFENSLDKILIILCKLKEIKKIHLENVYISDNTILTHLISHWPKLEVINYTNLFSQNGSTDLVPKHLLDSAKNLKSLVFSYASKSIGDRTHFKKTPMDTEPNSAGQVSDTIPDFLSRQLNKLEFHRALHPSAYKGLSQLKSMHIGNCSVQEIAEFAEALGNYPSLEKLHLENIDLYNLKIFNSLIEKFPNLRSLKIDCCNVNLEIIESINKKCPKLKSLHFNKIILSFFNSCDFPHLERFFVDNSPIINGVKINLSKFKNIKKLELTKYCEFLGNVFLNSLRELRGSVLNADQLLKFGNRIKIFTPIEGFRRSETWPKMPDLEVLNLNLCVSLEDNLKKFIKESSNLHSLNLDWNVRSYGCDKDEISAHLASQCADLINERPDLKVISIDYSARICLAEGILGKMKQISECHQKNMASSNFETPSMLID